MSDLKCSINPPSENSPVGFVTSTGKTYTLTKSYSGGEQNKTIEISIADLQTTSNSGPSAPTLIASAGGKTPAFFVSNNDVDDDFAEVEFKRDEEDFFFCPVTRCGYRAQELKSMRTHYQLKHGTLRLSARYTCAKCQRKCLTREALYQHLERCGRKQRKRRGVADGSCKTIFPCEQCGGSYSSKVSLLCHMNRQHNLADKTADYECTICQQQFILPKDLEDHMDRVHLKCTKRWRCQECGASFTHSALFIGHMNKHKGIKPYNCEHCDECFHSSQSLKSHRIRMHRNPIFYCPAHCGYKTNDSYDMRLHVLRKHTPREHWQYPCDICQLRFVTSSDLKSHKKKHEPQILCQRCNKKFTTHPALELHMETPGACERYLRVMYANRCRTRHEGGRPPKSRLLKDSQLTTLGYVSSASPETLRRKMAQQGSDESDGETPISVPVFASRPGVLPPSTPSSSQLLGGGKFSLRPLGPGPQIQTSSTASVSSTSASEATGGSHSSRMQPEALVATGNVATSGQNKNVPTKGTNVDASSDVDMIKSIKQEKADSGAEVFNTQLTIQAPTSEIQVPIASSPSKVVIESTQDGHEQTLEVDASKVVEYTDKNGDTYVIVCENETDIQNLSEETIQQLIQNA